MITFVSVFKKYGSQTVFEDLNFEIPTGKTTVITGPSGCGKTTLLRMISGLDRDYSGSISGVPERISYAFQEDRLLPWKTARGNIEFALRDVMSGSDIDKTVEEMIDSVRLTGHADKLPKDLSGGMRSRVSLARALRFPNDLLLLDEPFTGLDETLKGEMIALLDRLYVSAGRTVILVAHDPGVARALRCGVVDVAELKSK